METVNLLAGYEAIFGQEMWRNAIVETTYWEHSKEAYVERKKQMLSEESRRSDWENDLKTKYQLSIGNQPLSFKKCSKLSKPLQELVL